MAKAPQMTSSGQPIRHTPLSTKIWNCRGYYIMFIPVLIFVLIMHYWPMLGIRYAFMNFRAFGKPTYIGLAHFQDMFHEKGFWTAFRNTLELSIIKLFLTTFTAVVASVFLNEMNTLWAKKSLQTVIYLPHFMSWAVVAGIFSMILSPNPANGMVNGMLLNAGIIKEPLGFLQDKGMWRAIFYTINIWKETGWGTIIFLATLSGINPELYEAADIDGATRLQKIWYVTVPALMNTIIVVLILNLAKVMNLFESVFVLYNSAVLDVSDVISTFLYGKAFSANPNYGYATAVGLFKSIVGGFLVLVCNQLSKKVRGRGIV